MQQKLLIIAALIAVTIGLSACGSYYPHPIHTKVTREFYYGNLQQAPADNDESYFLYYYNTPRQDNPGTHSSDSRYSGIIPSPAGGTKKNFRNSPARNNPTVVVIPPVDNDSSYSMPSSPAIVVMPNGRGGYGGGNMGYPRDNDSFYTPPPANTNGGAGSLPLTFQ